MNTYVCNVGINTDCLCTGIGVRGEKVAFELEVTVESDNVAISLWKMCKTIYIFVT